MAESWELTAEDIDRVLFPVGSPMPMGNCFPEIEQAARRKLVEDIERESSEFPGMGCHLYVPMQYWERLRKAVGL